MRGHWANGHRLKKADAEVIAFAVMMGGEAGGKVTPFWQTTDGTIRTLVGDSLDVLRSMPSDSVHCCVTSPPYFGLRDYKIDGQIGLEKSPAEFVSRLVDVFREVRRVLHPSGVVWVNIGDSYNAAGRAGHGTRVGNKQESNRGNCSARPNCDSLKEKDLIGAPWMLAFALRDDGWYLRQEIIWHKPAPMPESVTDRCTKAHEQVFLLAKSARYFFDAEAVKEPSIGGEKSWRHAGNWAVGADHSSVGWNQGDKAERRTAKPDYAEIATHRNRRSVWTVASEPFPGSHFATFPSELIRPMIRAGSSERGVCRSCLAPWERIADRKKLRRERPNELTKRTGTNGTGNHCPNTVAGVSVTTRGWQPTCKCDAGDPIPATILDPFGGSGTTGMVARQEGRACVMIELNPEYAKMHRERVMQVRVMADDDAPLLAMLR